MDQQQQQQYQQAPPQQQQYQPQQHSGGGFRGGGRGGGGRGRGRGGGGGRGFGGRGRGGGRGGGGRGRGGGRGGFSHSYPHHQQHNDQQQQTAFEDYGPQSHVLNHNGNSHSGGGDGYYAQPPPVPAAPVHHHQQQQQQQLNNLPGFLNVAAYANGGQQQQPHQQAAYQPPPQYQQPQSGYGAPPVPTSGYGVQPAYQQSSPPFQQQQQPQRSYDMGANGNAPPPLPSQPPPSEPTAESSEFVPPLPKQPAPPLPVSPALTPAAPQQASSGPPQPPMYPQQTQSGYSDALYSRQQAYAPVNPQQQQQVAPPLLPTPAQAQYHAPQAQYQPQYQVPQPQYQVPPPMPPSYGQPGGYHHPHHQPQQHQQYVQPAAVYAAPPQQYHQHQSPVHQPQPPLPRSQPPQQQQQPGSRPPPSTYCCHKCGQPGHWIQDCQSTQNNYNRGGGDRGQRPTSHGNYQLPAYHQQQQPQTPAPYQQQQQQRQHQRPPQQDSHQLPPQPPSTFQSAPPSYYTPQASTESLDQVDNRQQDESMEPEQERYGAPLSECPPLPDIRQQQQQQQWCCENCDKSFTMESQFDAHVKTHVSCHAPECDFSASKRVVGAHFQTAHGQFAGSGLKEIDIEGQKFMVLVGNSPEDIAAWRAERRKKWPSVAKQSNENQQEPVVETKVPSKKRKLSSATLDNGGDEDLEDGEIDEEEPKANGQQSGDQCETGQADQAEPSAASEPAPVDGSEPSPKRQKRVWLCKNFLRNQCRFGDECKFSHDRKDVLCRSMLQKGKCSKGDACLYSHDAVQIAGAAVKLKTKNANKPSKGEKVLEEKWKTEQGSLLRKLLKKDMRVEQHQMLQIVRTIVSSQFFKGQTHSSQPVVAQDDTTTSGVTVLSSSEAQ